MYAFLVPMSATQPTVNPGTEVAVAGSGTAADRGPSRRGVGHRRRPRRPKPRPGPNLEKATECWGHLGYVRLVPQGASPQAHRYYRLLASSPDLTPIETP
jgi:hypothetical protein